MLVLSRNIGQKIMIGDDTEVEVLSVKGDSIKFCVDTPKHVQAPDSKTKRKVISLRRKKNGH